MYQQFFQFRRLPFQLTPDPHFFFFTSCHEEAFNQARYTVKERKGFMVLTGEVGTGKTTLSRLLIEHLGQRAKSSLLFNPNLTTVELLQSINHDFGINDQSYSKKVLTDALNQFLLEELMQGGNAVLVVDEAQTLPVECLEEIRLLSNLETPRAKLLQILLIGQPELSDKLALPQLRQLNQRITLRAQLAPLEPQEVADYIEYRLWRAGGREAAHFEPAAIELVWRYTQGIPRLINALCDRALLAAYVRGTRLISGYLMGQAIGELAPILPMSESPPAHLTREAPALPKPEPPSQARSDAPVRLAFIGLASLVVGLLLLWWRTDSLEERFPTALLAREQAVLEPPAGPLERWPSASPAPLLDALPSPRVPVLPSEVTTAPSAEPEPAATAVVSPREPPPTEPPETAAPSEPTVWSQLAFKVDHAVPIDAELPVAPDADPPLAEWSLDADGVLRAEAPELMERAAALMLLREWGAVPEWPPAAPPKQPIDPVAADPAALARDQRLEELSLPLSVQELLRLDYPMILLRRSRDPAQPPYPVVVSRVADGTATLLDPRVGLVRRPIQVIEQELSGPARLYWRPLNSWRWPGAVDGADPVIHWLQRRLRAAELYRGPMDGLVGPETEQALQRLAGQRGLEVTSTSPLLELLISQLLAPAEFPRLSSPAG